MELDCDTAIKAFQQLIAQEELLQSASYLELSTLAYCITFLCQNEEYSVREYAEHALQLVLGRLTDFTAAEVESLVKVMEQQFVGVYIVALKDELALKTVLKCVRTLIMFVKEHDVATRHDLAALHQLCNTKEENLDFFVNCLGIKLKDKQRCLKMLKNKIEAGEFAGCLRSVEKVLMPVVDYLVFGGATQAQNRRNTISYDKDQKLNTLDEGLAIYTALASQLSWTDYFKLLKKLLHRLQRANTRSKSVSSHGAPELEKEKLITKALCCILHGFHFPEVKDAIEIL